MFEYIEVIIVLLFRRLFVFSEYALSPHIDSSCPPTINEFVTLAAVVAFRLPFKLVDFLAYNMAKDPWSLLPLGSGCTTDEDGIIDCIPTKLVGRKVCKNYVQFFFFSSTIQNFQMLTLSILF